MIANFLSDSVENLGGDYRPTAGVRIVEFETQNLNGKNTGLKADIELWDCSGDLKWVKHILTLYLYWTIFLVGVFKVVTEPVLQCWNNKKSGTPEVHWIFSLERRDLSSQIDIFVSNNGYNDLITELIKTKKNCATLKWVGLKLLRVSKKANCKSLSLDDLSNEIYTFIVSSTSQGPMWRWETIHWL